MCFRPELRVNSEGERLTFCAWAFELVRRVCDPAGDRRGQTAFQNTWKCDRRIVRHEFKGRALVKVVRGFQGLPVTPKCLRRKVGPLVVFLSGK